MISTAAAPTTLQQHSQESDWGYAPILSVITALGLLIVVVSYNSSRHGMAHSVLLYWAGVLIQFLPAAIRLLSPNIKRIEAIAIVFTVGLCFYLTKLLFSPLEFQFVDELQQWRSAYDALQANHLFEPNPILEISPYYPGLQNSINAIVSVSGLSIFHAGVILLGFIRVMWMMTLYLFFEQVSGSHRIAGVSTLVYMANPAFLGWASYAVYQSLALPMVFLALYTLIRLRQTWSSTRLGLSIIVVPFFATVIITHHVSSYIMAGYLTLFAVVPWLRNSLPDSRLWATVKAVIRLFSGRTAWHWLRERYSGGDKHYEWQIVAWAALTSVIGITLWIVYIATPTIDYLGPQAEDVYHDISTLVEGRDTGKEIYVAPDRPTSELLLGIGALGLIMVSLPWGMQQTLHRYRGDSLGLSMIVGAGSFYISLLIRFVSHRGGELLARMWPFLFLFMAFVIAIGIIDLYDSRRWGKLVRFALPGFLAVLLVGDVINGWPPHYSRLPGTYLAGAFERSIDEQSLEASDWARDTLGHNNRIAGGFVFVHLLGAYSLQNPVMGQTEIYWSDQISDYQASLMRENEIEYVAVDMRWSTMLPEAGFYIGAWETYGRSKLEAIDAANLTKFDDLIGTDRIYDNGAIVFYDVRDFTRVE